MCNKNVILLSRACDVLQTVLFRQIGDLGRIRSIRGLFTRTIK